MKKNILLFFICLILNGCIKSDFYENNYIIENYKWDYNDMASFKVNIVDTTQLYTVNVNIRHHESYKYVNLWLNINTINPDTVKLSERVQITLAEPSGKWIGNGLNEIWSLNKIIKSKVKFTKPGIYNFQIEHDMRINPLPAIMSVGIKVQKQSANDNLN
jgi:gliding motility-associated lipoprotein GldH